MFVFQDTYDVYVLVLSWQVWGCGGRAVLEEQAKQKKWELKDAEKHKQRKVNIVHTHTHTVQVLYIRTYIYQCCEYTHTYTGSVVHTTYTHI